MDLQLVDIDKVLDDLESLEHNSSGVVVDLGSVPQPPSTNRRIKVRSVLSSLNDYVDYDSKSNEMQGVLSLIVSTLLFVPPHTDGPLISRTSRLCRKRFGTTKEYPESPVVRTISWPQCKQK